MFYPYSYYRGFSYPFASPYWGYGGINQFGNFGLGINAIGSQFNNQSLVNTGSMIGSSQIQSPVNVW